MSWHHYVTLAGLSELIGQQQFAEAAGEEVPWHIVFVELEEGYDRRQVAAAVEYAAAHNIVAATRGPAPRRTAPSAQEEVVRMRQKLTGLMDKLGVTQARLDDMVNAPGLLVAADVAEVHREVDSLVAQIETERARMAELMVRMVGAQPS